MRDRTAPSSSAAALGDKPCIYCGGSLQGITAADRCPQCGRLAIDSLLGSHLRDASHDWLRTILRGILLSTAGVSGMILLRGLDLFHLLDPQETLFDIGFYRFFVSIAAWCLYAAGVMLVTSAEPSDSLVARRRGMAWLLRIAVLIVTAMAFVPSRVFARLDQPYIQDVILAVWSVALVIAFAKLLRFLRRLIDRTPRREVSARLTALFYITIPLIALTSPISIHLASQHLLAQRGQAMYKAVALSILLVHHAVTVALLILTRNAIKRTVGYWS